MHKPNVHPELQMQQMLQVDLLLRPANLTGLVPTWHGGSFPDEPKSQSGSPNQPPTKIYKTAAKTVK